MKHPVCGFENCHRHSDQGSPLDGYARVMEYCAYSPEVNQKFVILTDHGSMASVPQLVLGCEKFNLHPIFGCELYLNDFQPEIDSKEDYDDFMKDLNEEEKIKLRKNYHLTAIASSNKGYSNLVNLSSWAWVHGLGGRPKRPRVTHKKLIEHKQGITFLSGCYNSEIGQAFHNGGEEAGYVMIEKYMEMFKEHFYLEIMMLDFKDQKPYDAFLVKAHDKYHIPMVITGDCHYCKKDEFIYQRYMLMVKTGNTIANMEEKLKNDPDADFFELQDTNLWMKSEDELNQMWEAKYSDIIPYELYKEAKINSVKICEMSKGVELDRSLKLPQIPDADGLFKEAIKKGFVERHLPKTKVYLDRIREEYDLICKKGFSSYFLIQKQMTDEARRMCPTILGWGDGNEAVGPGRGSAVSALTCYCLGITDVDPVKHDLLFSRFLSENRGGKSLKLKFTIDPE